MHDHQDCIHQTKECQDKIKPLLIVLKNNCMQLEQKNIFYVFDKQRITYSKNILYKTYKPIM